MPTTEQALFELTTFPLFDLENAIEKTGSEAMTKEILRLMSSQEIPTDLEALQKAYTENNWPEIEKLAHKIKGGAIYCGTVRLKYACQYLERYQKAGHTKELTKLYKQLIKVLEETKEHIEAWLKNASIG